MKRLFFALELSDEVRDGLEQLRVRLQHHLPDARWVRPELMHVTVKFLGNTPNDQVGDVIEAGLAAVEGAGVCRLEAAGLGAFPGARRPRVVWVGLRGDLSPLARVVQHLETALEGLGFPKERREFSPHITLARARRGKRLPSVADLIAKQGDSTIGLIAVSKLVLFESELTRTGPIYTAAAHFPLEGS